MQEEKNTIKLNEEDLEKVSGGDAMTMPMGTDEGETDKATLENLQDNKGADE